MACSYPRADSIQADGQQGVPDAGGEATPQDRPKGPATGSVSIADSH
jgi:hypothetical protein